MDEITKLIQSLTDGGFDIETIKQFFATIAENPIVAQVIAKITELVGQLPIG